MNGMNGRKRKHFIFINFKQRYLTQKWKYFSGFCTLNAVMIGKCMLERKSS